MMRFVGSFFGSDRLMTVSMPSVGPTMYERHRSFSNLTVFFYFYFWFQIWMLPPLERSLEGESNCKLRVASRKKIQVVMHATSSIIRSSCFSSLVCQCYKQNKQNKERERMREREREKAGCSAGCRLVVSEVGAATSRGAQAGEGSIIKQWIAKSCICHTHNSLSLPPSVFISGMLLFTPCCLKPVSQTDSPVSLSSLSLSI